MGIHIVKRENCPLWKKALFYAIAIFSALLIGAIILLAIDVNPFQYYTRMFTIGTIGNRYPGRILTSYLNDYVPLVLTSLALSLAFKMRFWNIGGEGQFIMGALGASIVALKLGTVLPSPIVLILMCLAAMLFAGLYGLIVAALKVKFGTNETLLTLMFNYIALYLLTYLLETKAPWNFFLQADVSRPVPEKFADAAKFPMLVKIPATKFSLSICVLLVFIIGVLIFVYLKKTKQGYEINVVGDSAGTARYAGMKVNRIVLRTVFLSACLVGLAAAFKMGTVGTLSTSITNDVGWTAIIVAWLSQLNTWAIFAVSALINILHCGSNAAATMFRQVDSSFANMLQGFILFLVLVADFMIRFKFVRTKKEGSHE